MPGLTAILEAHRPPPLRKGTPRRLARAAQTYRTRAGSGLPKVGAPDCMEMELAKVPKTTGALGRTSWAKAMPAKALARICWMRRKLPQD